MVTHHAVIVLLLVTWPQLQPVIRDLCLGQGMKSEDNPEIRGADLCAANVPVTTRVPHCPAHCRHTHPARAEEPDLVTIILASYDSSLMLLYSPPAQCWSS